MLDRDFRNSYWTALRSLTLAVVALAFASSSLMASEREFTGREAQAIALAVHTFKTTRYPRRRSDDLAYGDLDHFTVSLERHNDELEVIFVPDPSPKPQRYKNVPYLELGGTSVYGSEVHYHISLRRMKILRETYGR